MENSHSEHQLETLDFETLFERLESGNTLITANSRLSRILSDQYSQWRIKQGEQQWSSPNITSWNLWLDQLWELATLEGITGPQLAIPNQGQQIYLWEAVLKNDKLAASLLRPESLAQKLNDTRKLIKNWELDLSDFSWMSESNENHAAFHHWNGQFELLCKKSGWLATEDRLPLLCHAFASAKISLPNIIDLLGFDELNPAQQSLLAALEQQQVHINHLQINPANSNTVVFEATDHSHEIEAMASWVRYHLETEPGANIAVVAPDLSANKLEIEEQLNAILCPDIGSSDEKPWNISMGTALRRIPMIAAAFDSLNLLKRQIDIQSVGRVLRSPWLDGGISERKQRALLEKQLRDTYPRALKLTEVRYQAQAVTEKDRDGIDIPADKQEAKPWNCPQLVRLINLLINFKQQHSNRQTASTWAELFDKLLSSLGWPFSAENQANPEEHNQNWQTMTAWNESLRQLASLDAVSTKISLNHAIGMLAQICQDKIYQTKKAPTTIQVLGLYEISGLRFDHLWVMGLQATSWPPAAKPNPFIPASLQQQHNIPNSNPRRELEVAITITQRLLETATDTVFSYSATADGESQQASPLLDDIQRVTEVPHWDGKTWREIVANASTAKWETLKMPAPLGSQAARGGSSILKNQANCPFSAFAKNRLIAEGLNTPVDGIDQKLHGTLLHSVMENFWEQTKTQIALLELSDTELRQRVQNIIKTVLDENRSLRQRPAFMEVEAMRIERKVITWLELEKQREDFSVVALEKKLSPEIEGQKINLYIDRIDQLSNGSKLIIDYKTGKVQPSKWYGDRPEDPQMPLYATHADQVGIDNPAGVAFAVISDGEYCFKGILNQSGVFNEEPPKGQTGLKNEGAEFPIIIDNWRQILHRLMREFLQGNAEIDPKNGIKTCSSSYCGLQALCRINELSEQQKLGSGEGP